MDVVLNKEKSRETLLSYFGWWIGLDCCVDGNGSSKNIMKILGFQQAKLKNSNVKLSLLGAQVAEAPIKVE